MPTNEEGEFELVLGNKQLLSVFFIVVVLLGVFFTMGYIVGRNMSPAAGPQVASGREGALVVESTPPPASTTAPPPVETATAPPPDKPSPMPGKVDPPKPDPVKTESPKPEPPKPPPAKPEPPKPEPPKPAPPKPAPPSAGGAGLYLQVAATKEPDAKMLVDVLGKKGFRAVTQAVPDSPLFRVLVGPARDADDLAKLRTGLEAIGFKGFPKRI